VENERLDFPSGAADLQAQVGPFFARGFACGEVAGDEIGQILTGRLASDFQDRVAPAEAGFGSGAFFEDGEDLGGWISNQAEAFGEVGDFHGGRGGAGSGFENKAEVIWGGKFESSETKVLEKGELKIYLTDEPGPFFGRVENFLGSGSVGSLQRIVLESVG
jgi:hypothetical protein